MKSIGIVRKVDELGRVVLPMELRRTMDIQEGTPMEMFVDGDTIMLKKYQPGCILCSSMDNLYQFNGKTVCTKCIPQ